MLKKSPANRNYIIIFNVTLLLKARQTNLIILPRVVTSSTHHVVTFFLLSPNETDMINLFVRRQSNRISSFRNVVSRDFDFN